MSFELVGREAGACPIGACSEILHMYESWFRLRALGRLVQSCALLHVALWRSIAVHMQDSGLERRANLR